MDVKIVLLIKQKYNEVQCGHDSDIYNLFGIEFYINIHESTLNALCRCYFKTIKIISSSVKVAGNALRELKTNKQTNKHDSQG